MISHAGLAVLAAVPASGPNPDSLPDGWRADGGIAVSTRHGTLQMYGDTLRPEGGMIHNTITVGEVVITQALKDTASGSFYWPMDAFELPDGSLFVLASEVVKTDDGFWGFKGTDTDAFVVSDPTAPMAWHLARKVDDGPWEHRSVVFLDQHPHLAAVREPGSAATHIWQLDPENPEAPWTDLGETFNNSQGVFVPVQTADRWLGTSWEYGVGGTLWESDSAMGPWTQVMAIPDSEGHATYGHMLDVIEGHVFWRWSNANGDQRPEWWPVS